MSLFTPTTEVSLEVAKVGMASFSWKSIPSKKTKSGMLMTPIQHSSFTSSQYVNAPVLHSAAIRPNVFASLSIFKRDQTGANIREEININEGRFSELSNWANTVYTALSTGYSKYWSENGALIGQDTFESPRYTNNRSQYFAILPSTVNTGETSIPGAIIYFNGNTVSETVTYQTIMNMLAKMVELPTSSIRETLAGLLIQVSVEDKLNAILEQLGLNTSIDYKAKKQTQAPPRLGGNQNGYQQQNNFQQQGGYQQQPIQSQFQPNGMQQQPNINPTPQYPGNQPQQGGYQQQPIQNNTPAYNGAESQQQPIQNNIPAQETPVTKTNMDSVYDNFNKAKQEEPEVEPTHTQPQATNGPTINSNASLSNLSKNIPTEAIDGDPDLASINDVSSGANPADDLDF